MISSLMLETELNFLISCEENGAKTTNKGCKAFFALFIQCSFFGNFVTSSIYFLASTGMCVGKGEGLGGRERVGNLTYMQISSLYCCCCCCCLSGE